jgi:hypothetical protein
VEDRKSYQAWRAVVEVLESRLLLSNSVTTHLLITQGPTDAYLARTVPTLTKLKLPQQSAASSAFAINNRVQSTANLNVRSTFSTSGTLITTETTGSLGTVTGGPQTGSGLTWYSVKWDNGFSGWSDAEFLTAEVVPTMSLQSPNAGATWQVGTSQTVSWTASGGTSNVGYFQVFLSTNGAASYSQISQNLGSSTRSFSYTPNNGQGTSAAVIWVKAFDSQGNFLAGAISNGDFTIANPAPTISVTNPFAGTTWQAGTAYTINWSASGNTSGIYGYLVYLSTNNGGSYSFIGDTVGASSQSLNYTPNNSQATTSAVIWVKAIDSGSNVIASGFTNGTFTIAAVAPTIGVTSPAVETTWQAGTAYAINWSASGDTSNVYGYLVYLSTNDGGSYSFIGDTVGASSQSLSYTPDNAEATTSAVIWVKAIDSGSNVIASGFTNGTFTIVAVAPTMGVTSPAAGTIWQTGTAYTINWSVTGDTSNIYGYLVYLSINDGGSYSFIGDTVGASSLSLSYTPNNAQATSSAVIWVKAIDSGSNVIAGGFTNGTFTISAATSSPDPSLLTLATLSDNIYSGNGGTATYSFIGGDSTFLSGFSVDPGFDAVAYTTNDHSQVVVAFRGTDTDNTVTAIMNVLADVSFVGGVPTPTLANYATAAADFVQNVHSLYNAAHITLTGHSLGGALAQLVGEVSGLTTDAFNAPGAQSLYQYLQPYLQAGNWSWNNEAGLNTNYRIYGDQISLAGSPIGMSDTLADPAQDFDVYTLTGDPITDAVNNLDVILNAHKIANFISDFQIIPIPQRSSAGEANIVAGLEADISPTTSKNLEDTKILDFILNVSYLTSTLIDPSSGSAFLFAGQVGSPDFASIDLPVLAGIASYRLAYESSGIWSGGQSIQPGTKWTFGTGATGLQFQPLDSSGQPIELDDTFIFDVSFTAAGTFTGSLAAATGASDVSPWISPDSAAQYTITGTVGQQVLDVTAGTLYLTADLSSDLPAYTLRIESGARVVLASDQRMAALQLLSGGTIDLENNAILIDYGAGLDPGGNIQSEINSGYNGGAWSGPGITSSYAAASAGEYSIGFADSSDPGNPAGLAPGQIELKYTLTGDANLDGTVNGVDFGIVAANFNKSATSWDQGDFNYDGVVNGIDFAQLSANFNKSATPNPPGLNPGASAQYAITGSPGAQVLDVQSGTITLSADLSNLFPNYTLLIEDGAKVALTSDQHIASLQILGAGSLDVANHSITINYGSNPDPISTLAASIKSGYNAGAWNGAGIFSSAAATNAASYGLGFADSADAGNPAGLPSGTILIKYTLLGDADLNGVVNGIDFGIVAANFNKGVTAWDQGDFNYDGIVNGIDFAYVAANFNKGAVTGSATSAGAALDPTPSQPAVQTTAKKTSTPAVLKHHPQKPPASPTPKHRSKK